MKNNHFHSLENKGLGDHNTVSSGPDNGANNYMANAFWKCMRHSTTEHAINNWNSRIKSNIDTENEIELFGNGNLNIGGHGNEGQLETGYGQNGTVDYKTNFLGTWNQFYWEPHFKKLIGKNFPIIYIYSCHTGAGSRGADFLYQMARVIGKPVAGRTGFTYSNNRRRIWFENGSVWQVALPDRRPTPIDSPTPHFTKLNMLKFSNGKEFIEINEDNIKQVSFSKNSFYTAGINVTQFNSDIEINKSMLKSFFASEPFEIDGELSAIITGNLTIVVGDSKGESTFQFDIYNDRLIGDKFGNYYYSDSLIYSIMQNI